MALLEINRLTVDFDGPRGIRAVDHVELSVERQSCVAIVGESGSGKSQLLLACTGLLAANGRASGSVCFDGMELLGAGDPAAQIRGSGIGFVFQDASGSLTPHRRIGDQLAEAGGATMADAERMLERVRLPDARRHLAEYPHELSGGMRQRVAIAAALMPQPQLLFADEPTTALDVTVQAEIIALLADLCRELGMAMLLVTHDLGVVSSLAERIAVMYAGRIVEIGPARDIYTNPKHPYTAALLRSIPDIDVREERLPAIMGSPPNLLRPPSGCAFHPRCPLADDRCRVEAPTLDEVVPGRASACFHADKVQR